jgi:branched-chain amino acid aminotransferase
MHNFISINGQIQKNNGGHASAMSSAAFFGKGIFTTIAIYESRPFLWEKHWRRLVDNAATIGIDLSEYTEAAIAESLCELLEQNNSVNGRARITFFDESESPIWSDSNEKKTSLSIITGDLRPVPKEFKLTVSPYLVNSKSPFVGVKSCNYLENILSMDEAKSRGFHESVRVNERGEITSGCMSNVFWLRDGKLFTPGLATGCLAGTTREFVLEYLECKEVIADLKLFQTTDEIFLTSAGIGVVQVAEFEGRRLEKRHHPILDLLKN